MFTLRITLMPHRKPKSSVLVEKKEKQMYALCVMLPLWTIWCSDKLLLFFFCLVD